MCICGKAFGIRRISVVLSLIHIYWILAGITGNGITSALDNTNYYFYMVMSHAITTADTEGEMCIRDRYKPCVQHTAGDTYDIR